MKDKDPNDDELNKDEQDNINEADDSFGLPDLDFTPLDEESEEEATEEEEVVEEAIEETVEEEIESEVEAEVEEEIVSEEEADAEEETAPIRSTYVPPKPESNTPKIIAVIIIVVLASVAIWYFGFYRPQAAADKARIEAAAKLKKDNDDKAAKEKADADRLAAEQTANQAADEDELASDEATFSTISESTGRYYIVIESFIDSDMAADYGKELVTKGYSTSLLSPKGKRKFHRLTMGNYGSFVEAQEEANRLKGEFGKDLWVLKY